MINLVQEFEFGKDNIVTAELLHPFTASEVIFSVSKPPGGPPAEKKFKLFVYGYPTVQFQRGE